VLPYEHKRLRLGDCLLQLLVVGCGPREVKQGPSRGRERESVSRAQVAPIDSRYPPERPTRARTPVHADNREHEILAGQPVAESPHRGRRPVTEDAVAAKIENSATPTQTATAAPA
jgi:hypothetical protein